MATTGDINEGCVVLIFLSITTIQHNPGCFISPIVQSTCGNVNIPVTRIMEMLGSKSAPTRHLYDSSLW